MILILDIRLFSCYNDVYINHFDTLINQKYGKAETRREKMFCKKCGKEIEDDAVICIHCGRSTVEQAPKPAPVPDIVSPGFCVLSFFIPLFGIIYWALKYKETPKRAKACGLTAIITWGATVLLYIIIFVVSFCVAMSGAMYY